ncbi:hypothetical protein HJC99_05375 [Candidatus Saccharibacteria bacterium]|nr:hypothetical protein [Candidatus Saccharibacteria bacterium]
MAQTKSNLPQLNADKPVDIACIDVYEQILLGSWSAYHRRAPVNDIGRDKYERCLKELSRLANIHQRSFATSTLGRIS